MIWLDFFLQVFVHALAWCLAVASTFALVIVVAWAGFRIGRRHRKRLSVKESRQS